jgi:tetratricopeptide (TPR) repeat protein
MAKKIKKYKPALGHLKKRKQVTVPRQKVSSQHDKLQQALALHQAGRLPDAEAHYRQILAINPNHPEALHFLGMLAHQAGRSEIAVELISKALHVRPDYADASYNLGIIFYTLGKQEEAIACFHQTLTAKPNFAEAHNNLGIIFNDQGKLEKAIDSFRRALALNPKHADAHNNLGNVFMAQGRLDEAAASYRGAIIFRPNHAEAHNNLGIALQRQGKADEAAVSYRRAISLNPDYLDAHYNLGVVLQEQDGLEEAADHYRRVISLKPDYVDAYNNLGVIYRDLGKMEDAVVCFKKALALRPDYAGIYKNLALLVKGTQADDVVHAMEDLYQTKKDISETDRIDLGFALGKLFEDRREYDKAFDCIRSANQVKRKSFDYVIQNDIDLFARIQKIFSPDFFDSHKDSGLQDSTPIFILGMPRSGTTLVEQILASHPLVFGADELTILEDLTKGLCRGGTMTPFPECVLDLDEDTFTRTGKDYIEKVRKFADDAQYITDKMPHNFLRIGLIKTILPKAKVIHCVRDPMDTCFSIFKKDFTGSHGYAYDLVELGQYYRLYQELMAHWEKVLPGFIYTQSYEGMVTDQLNQTKSLLDFCGLPWDEACLNFHKTERRVSSASHAQVRQPIYKGSIGLWRQYEKQLEPLRKAIYGRDP